MNFECSYKAGDLFRYCQPHGYINDIGLFYYTKTEHDQIVVHYFSIKENRMAYLVYTSYERYFMEL